MISLVKKFDLFTAHALTKSYEKEHQEIHGHHYKIYLHIRRQDGDVNRNGVVIDDKTLNNIFYNEIGKRFNYKLMLHYSGEAKIKTTEFKISYVDFNPTVENFAKHILEKINNSLESEECKCFQVDVYESDDKFAICVLDE